jgi:hypothetical protein
MAKKQAAGIRPAPKANRAPQKQTPTAHAAQGPSTGDSPAPVPRSARQRRETSPATRQASPRSPGHHSGHRKRSLRCLEGDSRAVVPLPEVPEAQRGLERREAPAPLQMVDAQQQGGVPHPAAEQGPAPCPETRPDAPLPCASTQQESPPPQDARQTVPPPFELTQRESVPRPESTQTVTSSPATTLGD